MLTLRKEPFKVLDYRKQKEKKKEKKERKGLRFYLAKAPDLITAKPTAPATAQLAIATPIIKIVLVEIVLISFFGEPLQRGHRGQVARISD